MSTSETQNATRHDPKVREQGVDLTIIDGIPIPISVLAADGKALYVNPLALENVGFTLEEVKRKGHLGLTCHPDDLDRVLDNRRTGLSKGLPFELEMRLLKDGAYRWNLVQYNPLRDESGSAIRWYVTAIDIEDRKRAEHALVRSQFYLREANRLASMGCWALSAAGFDYWSPEMFQIYGLDPGTRAPTVTEYLKLVPPEDREFIQQKIRQMLEDRLDFDFTKRILRPDGEVRYVRCAGSHLIDGSAFQGLVGTAMDVTNQERLMQRLRQSEQDLLTITDSISNPIAVLAPDGAMLYANRVTLNHSGLSLNDAKSGFYSRSCHPDDVARAQDERLRGLREEVPFEIEMRLLKHGKHRWHLAQYNPLKDERGHITRWYVTATDIDDQKRTEEGLRNENLVLREEIDRSSMFEEIVGSSKPVRQVLKHVETVASSDSTVLILGETGTGKELIARALHRRSKRANRVFIRVNCAAIPQSLIASELFGHEKGAFTGALQRRVGRFEAANGGTLFLDEIGELPMETQIALLRVLQEKEFERVGSNHPISVDVRVIAATNRDLPTAVAAGTFRQDLFYRLNVFPIEVPPLRERKDDLQLLVEYFVQRYSVKTGKDLHSIEKKTLDLLQSYDWPGNVRELQNVIERSVILSASNVFSVDEFWLSKKSATPVPPAKASSANNGNAAKGQVDPLSEREVIEAALAATRGRVSGPSGAAAKLGIPPSTLETRIKALKINKLQFKFH